MTLVLLTLLATASPAGVLLAPKAVAAATAPFAAPIIDGRLDDDLWRTARPITDFVQDEPSEGAAPTEPTEVMVAVDAHAVYIGARLGDASPELIRARLARRDEEVSSDYFLVFLDPHHDHRSGVYFGVNAAGTQYDGTMSNDDWNDDSWDGVWESGVQLDKHGWTLEMRIPLSQLRFDGRAGRRWGINFERVIDRKKEHVMLFITPRAQSGFVSRFPDLVGVETLAAPARVEVTPYVSLAGAYRKRELGDPYADSRQQRLRAGLDLKVGLGGHLTLDGTIFPDFGQVEVDPAVINLSDVETFYPEKRPFFIEGASIFNDFGVGGATDYWGIDWPHHQLFYSRRIGRAPQGELPDDVDFKAVPDAADILGAAKLSGKVGDWSLGSLAALTSAEQARISMDGVERTVPVEPLTGYGLLRAQRTLRGGRHGVGLLGTMVARDLSDPALRAQLSRTGAVAGLDGWITLDPERVWVMNVWGSYSRITGTAERITAAQQSSLRYFQRPLASHLGVDPTRTSLDGYTVRTSINKQSGRILANAAAGMISPGYEINDLGFLGTTDRINAHVGGGYRWPDPGRVLRNAVTLAAVFSDWDFSGARTGGGAFLKAQGKLRNYWNVWSQATLFPESIDTRRTRGGPAMLNPRGASGNLGWESDSGRPVSGGMNAGFDRGAHRSANDWWVGGFVSARIADRASLSLEPSYNRGRTFRQYLETEDDPSATATFGKRYLFGDLDQRTVSANLRASFIFTPRLSFQLFAQPLVSSLRYASVNSLAAPYTFLFERTQRDPGEFSKSVVSLRGSAVLRWEYLPGSTLYLVWNGNQGEEIPDTRFDFGGRVSGIGRLEPNHVFMAKLTYWWSR
jgi:hypothetical protein